MLDIDKLYKKLVDCHPGLKRGLVQCGYCGRELRVDPAICFKEGWPECCSYTMTLKADEEINNDADREMIGDDADFFDGDIGNK